MTRRAIEIHIEALLVDGVPFDPRAAAQLQAAVEHGLVRLVTAHGLPAVTGDARPRPVRLAPLARDAAARPDRLGMAVAQGVFDALAGAAPSRGGRR